MSVIGQQIKKYRTEMGFTQEKLGKIIGVTTQAVSKWERGSMPDAEVIPLIADALNISIDSLYGREEQEFAVTLSRQLSRMSHDDAYRYAFGICWAIEAGLVGEASAIEDFKDMFINKSITDNEKTKDYFAKIIHNSGMALTRMSPDFYHFFLMVEPKEGSILSQLEDISELRKVFALFADEKLLRILCYMYSFPPMPIAGSLIAKSTGLDENKTENCLETLCLNGLVRRSVVATLDGKINSYTVCPGSYAVPLFCFADEIAKKNIRPIFGVFERTKPLMEDPKK